MTVTHTMVCKVAYKNAAGEYVILEAMINPYATSTVDGDGAMQYNFAIPADAKEVKIVLAGDITGDGSIDTSDVSKINATLLGKEGGIEESDAMAIALADVNGDGKITTADIVLLNAARLGKKDLEW